MRFKDNVRVNNNFKLRRSIHLINEGMDNKYQLTTLVQEAEKSIKEKKRSVPVLNL